MVLCCVFCLRSLRGGLPRLRASPRPQQWLSAGAFIEELAVDGDRWLPLAKPTGRLSCAGEESEDEGGREGDSGQDEGGSSEAGSAWDPEVDGR